MVDDALLSQVALSTASSVVICDADRNMIWCNDAFHQLTGLTKEEAFGRSPGELLQGPDTDPATTERMREALRNNLPFDDEIINYHQDGEKYWIHLVINPVLNKAGEATHFIGIQHDITQRKNDHAAVEDLTERLSIATAGAKIGIWDFDLSSGSLVWDDLMHEIYGIPAEKSQGAYQDWCSSVLPEELAEAERKLQDSIANGTPFQAEFRIRRQNDGEIRWIEAQATLINDAQGNPERMLGVNTDITERRDLKERLEHMSILLERTNEAARALALGRSISKPVKPWWSTITRAIHEVDDAYEPNLEEAIKFYKEGEDRDTVVATIDQAMQDKSGWDFELRLITAKGNERWVRAIGNVECNAEGEVVRLFGAFQDIDQRKRTELALDAERQRLTQIIDATRVGTWEWNIQTGETIFNERWAGMLGRTLAELAPISIATWEALAHPDDLKLVEEAMRKHHAGETDFYDVEIRMLHKNGEWVWVHDRGRVVTWDDDGKPLMMMGTHSEITERKQAEVALREASHKAEAANRAKSQFLANMSHEIRTPINGVMGMAELLKDSTLGDQQRAWADGIIGSVEHLLTVINDILDFSKVESGHMATESIAFDIHELLYGVVESFRPRLGKSDVQCLLHIPPTLPRMWLGDPSRTRQIIVNLVGNAVKFTSEGFILVEASVTGDQQQPDAEQNLQIAVTDTGIGIPPDRIDSLFDPFEQVDNSTARRFGGSGLGLAICQRLVALFDGHIHVNSVINEGSTFTVQLPFATAEETVEPITPVLRGQHCLLIDAQSKHAVIAQEQLAALGATVSAHNVLSAGLSALSAQPVDVVLLDVFGQHVSPAQAIQHVRAQHNDVPVVLWSSSMPDNLDLLTECGYAGLLLKPCPIIEVGAIIHAVLSQSDEPAHELVTRYSVPKPTATNPNAAAMSLQDLRILVAEDNAVNQQVVRAMLDKAGAHVHVVSDGAAAIDALDHDPYDVVLMDVQMPHVDGLTATRTIRTHEASMNRSRIPIIALTANALVGDREECLAAGMDDYLSKPLRSHELFTTLQRWAKPALQTS